MFRHPTYHVVFRQPEVDEVQRVLLSPEAQHEVVRLDVAVYQALPVHRLEAVQHLDRDAQHRGHRERAAALLQQRLQVLPEERHDAVHEPALLPVELYLGEALLFALHSAEGVPHLHQHLDLALQDPALLALRLHLHRQHRAVHLLVQHAEHLPETALAHHVQHHETALNHVALLVR